MRPATMSANDVGTSVAEAGAVRLVIDSESMHVYVNVNAKLPCHDHAVTRTHARGQVHNAEVRV